MKAQTLIVGAGPAGALLAYLLSSRGIDTLLIERQSDFGREFRGELLMPSGLRALAGAGVSLAPVATSAPTLVEGRLNGRTFLSVDTSTFEPPLPTAVSQPELLEELVRLAEATGHFELRRGTGVRGVDRDEKGRVSLRVRDSQKDQDESLQAPLVIGADGRSSIIRRRLAPKVENRSTPLDVVWFKIPYPAHWAKAQARFEAGHGHLMIAVHTPENLLQAAWVIVKGTYGDLKARSMEDWAGLMADHTDPMLGAHLREHANQISRPFLLDAVADCVQGWSEPGTLLIGDAAHTMSPVGGQGLNLALRDAIVAANQLVPALKKGEGIDAAAARIEAIRAPEINLIQRLAAVPPRIVMGRTFAHEILRRIMGRIAGTQFGQARGARFASLFLNGVTDVELEV